MDRTPGASTRDAPPARVVAPAHPSRADRLARILGDVVTALLLATIALAAFIFYGLLDNRWYHVVAVTGGSMSPAIEAGDLIVITRPPSRIEPGMVLTLEVDGAVVTHRVDEVRMDGSFVTKGDANTVRDDFTSNEVRVVGEYRFRIPLLGSVLAQARAIASGAYFSASTGVTTDVGVGVGPEVNALPDALPLAEPAPNAAAPPALPDGDAGSTGAPEPAASPVSSPDAGSALPAGPQSDPDEPAPSVTPPTESAPPAPSDQESAAPVESEPPSSPPATAVPEPPPPVPTDPPPIEPDPDEPTPTEPASAPAEPSPAEPDPSGSDVPH